MKRLKDIESQGRRFRVSTDWDYWPGSGLVGVIVTLLDKHGDPTPESASRWGVNENDAAEVESVALGLADDITARVAPAFQAAA